MGDHEPLSYLCWTEGFSFPWTMYVKFHFGPFAEHRQDTRPTSSIAKTVRVDLADGFFSQKACRMRLCRHIGIGHIRNGCDTLSHCFHGVTNSKKQPNNQGRFFSAECFSTTRTPTPEVCLNPLHKCFWCGLLDNAFQTTETTHAFQLFCFNETKQTSKENHRMSKLFPFHLT